MSKKQISDLETIVATPDLEVLAGVLTGTEGSRPVRPPTPFRSWCSSRVDALTLRSA